MAAAWLGRGFGRGVKTRGGYGRGRGIVKRYKRNDFIVFAALSGPTTMSDTECETSDTEATGSDTNDDGYTTVTRKHTKAKRRRVISGDAVAASTRVTWCLYMNSLVTQISTPYLPMINFL